MPIPIKVLFLPLVPTSAKGSVNGEGAGTPPVLRNPKKNLFYHWYQIFLGPAKRLPGVLQKLHRGSGRRPGPPDRNGSISTQGSVAANRYPFYIWYRFEGSRQPGARSTATTPPTEKLQRYLFHRKHRSRQRYRFPPCCITARPRGRGTRPGPSHRLPDPGVPHAAARQGSVTYRSPGAFGHKDS